MTVARFAVARRDGDDDRDDGGRDAYRFRMLCEK